MDLSVVLTLVTLALCAVVFIAAASLLLGGPAGSTRPALPLTSRSVKLWPASPSRTPKIRARLRSVLTAARAQLAAAIACLVR